jgi:drug/metabolite transporter (DMT)-like permease
LLGEPGGEPTRLLDCNSILVPSDHKPPRWAILLAFAVVYVFWGSTYLAIRIAVGTIRPELLAGSRFLIAGLLMLGWCAITGRKVRLNRGEAWRLAWIGFLLLSVSNTNLGWAEQWVPTGMAALLISIIPLWFLVIETWVLPTDYQPSARALAGLGLGVVGIVVLLWPELRHTDVLGRRELLGTLLLQGGCIAWAVGSLLSKRWKLQVDVFTASAYEMMFAGIINLLIGTALGDWAHSTWTWRGTGAILYLVTFGSLAGFSAYIYLLEHVATAKVTTYAYVNPVVAVFLGWLVLHERITGYIVAGTVIIVPAVALVTGAKLKPRLGRDSTGLRTVGTTAE